MSADTWLYGGAFALLVLPPLLRMLFPPNPLRMGFPQSHLLQQVLAKKKFRKRHNPWWLNLVRMVCLATLVALLMGWRWPAAELHPSASTVFLVDDTLYAHRKVDGKGLWERQRSRVEQLLSGLPESASVALLGRSGAMESWTQPSQLRQQLSRWEAGYGAENWPKVHRSLLRLHRQREQTSLQVSLQGIDRSEDPSAFASMVEQCPSDIAWLQHWGSADALNQGGIRVDREWLEGDQLNLKGFAQGPIDLVRSEVRERVSQGGELHLRLPSAQGAWLELGLADDFPPDNRHYLKGSHQENPRLIHFSQREASMRLQDSNYYLSRALEEICRQRQMAYLSWSPLNWEKLKAGRGDVIFFHHMPRLKASEIETLARALEDGARLVLMPGPLTPLQSLDHLPFAPAKLKGKRQQIQPLWPESMAQRMPTISQLTLSEGWSLVDLHRESETLVRLEDGSPYWIHRQVGPGRVDLFSSPFHIVWSQAVLKVDFPAALHLILDEVLDQGHSKMDWIPGLPWPRDLASIRSKVPGVESGSTIRPGHFDLVWRDGREESIVVNLENEALRPRWPVDLKPQQTSGEKGPTLGRGSRIDSLLALLVLSLLILEVWVLQRQSPQLLRRAQA